MSRHPMPRVRPWRVVAAVATLCSPAIVQAQTPPAEDAVLGVWETEPEDDGQWSRVEIERCGADSTRFCGRIVWLSDPLVTERENPAEAGNPKLDVHNPDESLRDRPILGLPLMHGFRYDDGTWKDGRIYDPKSGKTYRCELKIADGGRRLYVRGFVKVAFVRVGRTTEWTRYVEGAGPNGT